MPHAMSTVAFLRSGVRVSALSIAWTVVASTVAIVIGAWAANLVLIAFGCTGLLDAAGSVALVVHFRHALKHETFSERHEHVAFLIVTGGLILVALATVVESLSRLLTQTQTQGGQTAVGTGVAAASVVVLAVLSGRKVALGRAIPSQALLADGLLSATGAVLAVVTVLGTLLSSVGWWWADPVAALIVAVGALGMAILLAQQ